MRRISRLFQNLGALQDKSPSKVCGSRCTRSPSRRSSSVFSLTCRRATPSTPPRMFWRTIPLLRRVEIQSTHPQHQTLVKSGNAVSKFLKRLTGERAAFEFKIIDHPLVGVRKVDLRLDIYMHFSVELFSSRIILKVWCVLFRACQAHLN